MSKLKVVVILLCIVLLSIVGYGVYGDGFGHGVSSGENFDINTSLPIQKDNPRTKLSAVELHTPAIAKSTLKVDKNGVAKIELPDDTIFEWPDVPSGDLLEGPVDFPDDTIFELLDVFDDDTPEGVPVDFPDGLYPDGFLKLKPKK